MDTFTIVLIVVAVLLLVGFVVAEIRRRATPEHRIRPDEGRRSQAEMLNRGGAGPGTGADGGGVGGL